MTDSEQIEKAKQYVGFFNKKEKYGAIYHVVNEVWDDLSKSEKRLIISWLISKL